MKSIPLLFLLLSNVAARGANGSTWSSAAARDVKAAYSIFRDNHPGWFDPTNTRFRSQLTRARNRALIKASRAHSYSDYAESLGTFSGELQDGHARLVAKPSPTAAPIMWPGFVTAWRGESLFVLSGDAPKGVKIGDRIVACDGLPIRQVISKRLWSQGMRVREAGHWWARSPQAFVDLPTMNTPHPRTCEFRSDSTARRRKLNWTAAPRDINDRLRFAANGERTPIGLTEPRPGLFFIGLPDFNPDETGTAAYHRLFADLNARRAELHRARAIVIDLRWNDGGSSDWGRTTSELLWGKDAVASRMNRYLRNVQLWWRASRENLDYMRQLASEEGSGGAPELQLADKMSAARAAGKPFYVEPLFDERLRRASPDSDLRTPVYVIVPGGCASACLDALDTFKRFKRVTLIGAPSAGDTLYVDARSQELPSGRGIAVIPLKIWMNRPRRSGQVYFPDIELDKLDWSTANFIEAVERDLRRRQTGRPRQAGGIIRSEIKRYDEGRGNDEAQVRR